MVWFLSGTIVRGPFAQVLDQIILAKRHGHYQKLVKGFKGPVYKLLLIFMFIAYTCKSFIPNKTTFIKYCLTQWISKLPRSFEIHWVRQYLVHFTGLLCMANATVYMNDPIFTGLRHGKLSYLLTLHGTLKTNSCHNMNFVVTHIISSHHKPLVTF